jgi:hypothetical protein
MTINTRRTPRASSQLPSAACYLALGLAFLSLLLGSAAAWITHVIVCIKASAWILLLFGCVVAPVGVIHGVGVWLGVF